MLKFDEQKQIDSVRGALALRTQIEQIVDTVWHDGLTNLCWLGIGGTWASCLQAHCHMKERSALDIFVSNAAEYCAAGDRRIGPGTLVIISSVTGTTVEIVEAVKKVREAGARVLGFIDKPEVPLASSVDFCISYPANEQLKFFMAADRILWHEGVMPEYEAMYQQFDAALPEALVEVEKAADTFGEDFARRHRDDALHEEDTPVTLFIGEDAQRSLGERVARFLPKVCQNYTVIDTREYALPGIDDAFRPAVCHLVMHAVTNRIDAHLEALSGHDMKLRRYYRKMDY